MGNSCTVIRRKLVRTGTLNMITGEHQTTGEEWRTEPCGTPLFTDDERRSDICRSCASGWTHPDNYPVPTATA
jgi:hypothetical protein